MIGANGNHRRSPCKVLHLLPYNGIGGTEKAALNLCLADPDAAAGVLFTYDGPGRSLFEARGIPTYVLRFDGDAIRIDQTVERFLLGSDVLHLHTCHDIPFAYRFAERARKPFLITLQWPTPLPRIPCPIVSVSAEVRALQSPDNWTMVIPNGVHIPDYEVCDQAADPLRIVRVCRPEKCAPYFWPAVNEVLENHSNIELWIVGEGGLGNRQIRFLGQRTDVPELLRQCQIFVYTPPPDVGAHDLAVMEAMAAGLAVVTTDVPCVQSSVEDSHDGRLISFGEAGELVASLEQVINDRQLRCRLATNARATASERFSSAAVRSDYEFVYRQLLLST